MSNGIALRRFAKCLTVCTILLILAGSLVTSHDAGLSVPDWPTSYGWSMFTFPPSMWVANIFYEHVHRLIASASATEDSPDRRISRRVLSGFSASSRDANPEVRDLMAEIRRAVQPLRGR